MKIGLYGIRGTYNFGCEAIVRGAVKFIHDCFPNSEIIYFTYSFEYDKNILSDLNINIVPVFEKKKVWKRCINKALGMIGAERRLFYFDIKSMLKDIDIILSIGGDIYTIPVVLRKNKTYPYYNPLIDFCNRSGKRIIVYGASVGPWGDYHKAVDYYTRNMLKYKAILCRESETVDYLKRNGFRNAMFFPDPAFQLGEGINNSGNYIGVNLSPLSFNEVFGGLEEEKMVKLSLLLDQIIEKYHKPIMMLPHVLSTNENDNDLVFLQRIREKMVNANKVCIADSTGGFLKIKESIRSCCIVVAARMHCAINAVEENVPTIFLSYSQKSVGMSEYVYGYRKWLVKLENIEEQLIPLIQEMITDRSKVCKELSIQNQIIKENYNNNIKKVKELISD